MSNAIPTEYSGIRMRSRLEATWAAFFDLMSWPWVYEPFDLAGYIPDFLLRGAPGRSILLEMKPATDEPSLRSAAEKVEGLWDGDFAAVGVGLFEIEDFNDPPYDDISPVLGMGGIRVRPKEKRNPPYESTPGPIYFSRCMCGRHIPFTMSPNCHICDIQWQSGTPSPDDGVIRAAFATAKNRTQWRGEFGG